MRLFSHYDGGDIEDPAALPFLLARLLEEGDSADLRELFATVPEPTASSWLASHGGRQLSIRSRAFWEVVLGTPSSAPPPAASALWPL